MNWKAVRRTNDRRSAAKARREAAESARKTKIAEMGGPITLDEIRAATLRIEPPLPNCGQDRPVWTIRGKDWRMDCPGCDGKEWFAYPFQSYRQDIDLRETALPLTRHANAWMREHHWSDEPLF